MFNELSWETENVSITVPSKVNKGKNNIQKCTLSQPFMPSQNRPKVPKKKFFFLLSVNDKFKSIFLFFFLFLHIIIGKVYI